MLGNMAKSLCQDAEMLGDPSAPLGLLAKPLCQLDTTLRKMTESLDRHVETLSQGETPPGKFVATLCQEKKRAHRMAKRRGVLAETLPQLVKRLCQEDRMLRKMAGMLFQ
jgi:hypothetical protein